MNESKEPKKELREITYQVGWKRGKIQYNDQVPTHQASVLKVQSTESSKLWQLHLRYIWKRVPVCPSAMALPLLLAVPVISFLLTVFLVYQLTHQ